MPVDDPQFGEIWTTTDPSSGRMMQGIIADVSSTRIIFVSLTGNRIAMPIGRLRTTWAFEQSVPRRTLPTCERMGCLNNGMVEYLRVQRREYVCPKHVPTNTQSRLTMNYQPGPPMEVRTIRPGFECRSTPCPSCGALDPAEDVRLTAFPARFWMCVACNCRWVTFPRVPANDQPALDVTFQTAAHELGRWLYESDSILVLQQDSWSHLRRTETVLGPLEPESVPRLTLGGGLQAVLNTSIMSEAARAPFHAIMRVRSLAVRQADRPVQRLGGSPSRGGIGGDLPGYVRTLATPPRARPPATNIDVASVLRRLRETDVAVPAEQDPATTPVPDLPIDLQTTWIQRNGGKLIVVEEIVRAQDGSEAIKFRNATDDSEAAVTMIRRDFLIYHRPHVPTTDAPPPVPPMINVQIAEEWESQDGSGIIITQIDSRREIVHGDDVKTKKHRQIAFIEFATGRWRRIIRRSVYDRIRKPEISLTSGTGTEDD